MFTIAFNVA